MIPDKAVELLERRGIDRDLIVMACESGSTMHGVSVSAQDDLDLTVVRVETWDELVTGGMGNQSLMLRTQPEGERSGPGDVDVQVYTMRKYVGLLASGNPTILNTVFVPSYYRQHIAFDPEALARLVDQTRAAGAFLGYFRQQISNLRGERSARVSRPELVDQYGYDTKYAYHAIRLAMQGIEYFDSGRVTLPVSDVNAEILRSIRLGQWKESSVLEAADDLERQLEGHFHRLKEGPTETATGWRTYLNNWYDAWFEPTRHIG